MTEYFVKPLFREKDHNQTAIRTHPIRKKNLTTSDPNINQMTKKLSISKKLNWTKHIFFREEPLYFFFDKGTPYLILFLR